MTYWEKIYGLREMSLEEESQLSANEKLTVQNKIEIIDKCKLAQQALEQIRFRAKGTPVLNDPNHAEIVNQFADLVFKLERIAWETATFGIK